MKTGRSAPDDIEPHNQGPVATQRTRALQEVQMFQAFGRSFVPRSVIPPWLGYAKCSLRRTLTCRICGRTLHFVRFAQLSPVGIRGYYSDSAGHIVSINRSGATRLVGQDSERLYFA